MATRYELPLEPEQPAPEGIQSPSRRPALPQSILAANALWFCQLRWIVVAILAAYGILNFVPRLATSLGLRAPGPWPFIVAAILAAANTVFAMHARRARRNAAGCRMNLWVQIVSDLILLTVVVHFSAELQSIVSFAYLFHIVLACIFFDRRQSFGVLALALVLYAVALALDAYGIAPAAPVFAQPFAVAPGPEPLRWMEAFLFCLFCLVIWTLASRLSERVRERDNALSALNRSLIAAQEAKAKHMLRTTHELKAPFAAIQANVQLLTKGYCGELPEAAMDILSRIDTRSRRLANEIQEMLQLANLRSAEPDSLNWQEANVDAIVEWCAQQIQPLAAERKVSMDLDLQPARARLVEEQVRMLFSNLLANAVNYSHLEGRVTVRCQPRPDGGARVTIRDGGIGIEPDKLPMIFDEYYRTDRAAQHNKTSSGLGLAIVRHIAQTHRVRIAVQSEPDAGAEFTLDFPSPAARDYAQADEPANQTDERATRRR